MPKIYDQFGREIAPLKRPDTKPLTVDKIVDRWSTYPSQGMTPNALAVTLKMADQGDVLRQVELFEEMEEKDGHLFSVLQTRKNAVLGLEWNVNPCSEDKKDIEIAEACDDMLQEINGFDETLLDLLDAIGKGFAMSEINWDVSSGQAEIKSFEWVHQKKITFVNSMIPQLYDFNTQPQDIPPWRTVYFRYKARSGYDTRAGVLRTCAWMYIFKNYSLKDWVVFAEVFGLPLRIGKYEPGASPDDKAALLAAVKSIGTDAAGIISKNTEIEFIKAMEGGSRINIFEQLASFCDKQTSKAVLGHTGSVESTPGKLGAEHEARDVRQDLIEADCETLAIRAIRNHILRPFVGFNYGWEVPVPWFKFAFEPPEDLKEISEVYVNIGKMGFPLTAEHVSDRFKVPLPEKDQQILSPQGGGGFVAKYVAKGGFTPDQAALERMVEGVLKSAPEASKGLSKPIQEVIEKANSYEEIRANLADTFSDMDPLQFEDLMARSIFAAQMWGRYIAGVEDLRDRGPK